MMFKLYYYCFCISLSTLLFAQNTRAQENVNSYLTIDNGLVNNEITTIKQDKYGFMWFGTRGGLNKYDGYNLKLIRNQPNSKNNLSSQAVETMFAGKDNIWIGTKTGGLNKYNFLKDSIFYYPIPNVSGVINIFSVYETSNGDVYVGSSKGLYYLEYKTQRFKLIDNNIVNDIVADDEGGLWAATTYNVEHFNSHNQVTYQTTFGNPFLDATSLAIQKEKNTLYIGTWRKGLIVYNYKSGTVQNFVNNPKDDNSISNNDTYRVFLDRAGTLWIGTWGGGLNRFDASTGKFKKYAFTSLSTPNYFYKVVLSIQEDRSGVIWVGTEGGIYKINPQGNNFNNITYQYNNPNSLLNANIISIFKDSNNALWVGTKDGGLEYSADNKNFKRVVLNPAVKNNFRVNNVFQDKDYLWIGSNIGLFIINGLYPSNKTNYYTVLPKDSTGLSSNKVTSIIKDKQGAIWLGTQESGLNRVIGYKPTGEPLCKHYLLSSRPDQLQSERITCMFNDKKGRLWIGTFNGLHLYKRNTDNFLNFKHKIADTLSISNSIILSIAQDNQGTIWVGTPNGLNKMIDRSGKIAFKNYFANDNFPNDYINAILPDKHSRIWMSTNKGIVSFNPTTGEFRNFDIRDGLLSNTFSENAAYATNSGEFYFGGFKGITYFHPDSIKINRILPPVYFTDLQINNKHVQVGEEVEGNVPLPQSLFATKSITLNYKQGFISISFAALDYHTPDKNQYAYRLKGLETNWVNAGRRRSVTYTNLPSGDYTLEVKASNGDDIWNNKGTELYIKVLPPPWKSWWAYSIYIAAFVFLLWLSRYVGLNRLRLKNKLEIANIGLKREREITEIKSKLFTNISHEFRTPLTLMIGPLEDLSKTENLNYGVRKTVLSVQDQAKRLLNLVNQLLDFQKAESDKLTLNTTRSNIVSFSKEIFYSFRNEANRKNIKFQFIASSNTIMMEFDEEKMTIVLYNLLSNAFKFSGKGGSITLSIHALNRPDGDDDCEIIVSDTGKGIDASEMEKIFDRFYQVAKAEAGKFAGTGIGLAFTKDLVLLHSGTITVDSEPEKETNFHIILPVYQANNGRGIPEIDEPDELEPEDEHVDDEPETDEIIEDDQKPIVLVVEDNEEVNDYLVSIFKGIYNTHTAANGKEGLDLALQLIPDVIISDVMMPEMDGYELCHHLKSDIRTSHVPVILLTAQSDSSAHVKGVNEGADVYLSKPFNTEVLRSHVRNVLESRKKLKELFAQKVSLGPSEVEITSFEGEFIKKVIAKIESNITNSDFQTDALADEMNMSRSTFYRKLKAITDMSGSEFIRFIKVQRSAQLLLSGEFTIKQISYETGFNDTKVFRKCFLKQYKMTPSEYLKNEKAKALAQ